MNRKEAIAHAVKALSELPDTPLIARANHLDNFTHWAAGNAYYFMVDQINIDKSEGVDLFNALTEECMSVASRDRDRDFGPSRSPTVQAICKTVYESFRDEASPI